MITVVIEDESKPITQIDLSQGDEFVRFHVRHDPQMITIRNQPADNFSISSEIQQLFNLFFPSNLHRLLSDALIETISKNELSNQVLYIWRVFKNFSLDYITQTTLDALEHEDIFRAVMLSQHIDALEAMSVRLGKMNFAEKLVSYKLLL